MSINKCKACNKSFSTERGLSAHFQHRKECKLLHYKLFDNSRVMCNPQKNVNKEKVKAIWLRNDAKETSKYSQKLPAAHKPTNSDSVASFMMPTDQDDVSLLDKSSVPITLPLEINIVHEANCSDIENSNTTKTFSFLNDKQVENNLLKLLMDIGAPDYAFNKILKWARDAYNSGYKFNPKRTNYRSQIAAVEKHNNLLFLCPTIKHVTLPPDNLTLDVTCYDFSSMLSALLNNANINQMSNLVVNTNDPFSKYISSTGKLGEVNSGHWYHQAYNNLVKDPNKDFLLPIIFAMDKTTISSTAGLHVYAIMFTTTLFKRSIRNQANAWQPLGYIPIDRNHYSATQWTAMSSDLKSLQLNILFDTVLQSFRVAQKEGALSNVPLTLGDQTKLVNLKVPLAFIIGDIQGGDNICGRSAYYNSNARQICRMCNATPKVYNSNERDNCQLLVMEDIKTMYLNGNTMAFYNLMQFNTWQAFLI